ncbi:substrate-binding domain-containing protein [Nocardioides plantarum]|uniref:Substrate-binding domain-containing protein n=1 Tax=Nocardioides plantarum TaxID=29299 RepID=A0ABV5KFQ9_9ACTN|nr:substrate-binding domain-containing protein [Nocardioides plantarum]
MSNVHTRALLRGGVGLTVAAMLLTACTSAPKDENADGGSGPSSSGAAPDAAVVKGIVDDAGIVDNTDFCGDKDITLGIHDGFGINAWSQESLAAMRSEAAKCPNVKTIVQIGQGDLQKSISQVNSMVSQGIDALAIIPDFGQAQLASLQAATRAGVSVVPWGADPGGQDGSDYVSYVDWSSADAGTKWAEWMVKVLDGKGKVVFIGGPAGNPVTTGQLASIVKVFAKNPGMELLTGDKDWPVTNWDPATAQQVTASLLTKYPTIDGIISDYSTDALAATRAFDAAGRTVPPMATLDANGLGCFYDEQQAAGNKDFQLATISSRNWLGRVAVRKAIADAEGVANDEPSTYTLPFFEDSVDGTAPVCDKSLPEDFYPSNKISADDIAKYGKP